MQNKLCILSAMVWGIALGIAAPAAAQTTEAELKATILERDSLFWVGYNRCDTALTGRFIGERVEFFHDKGGITNGKAALQQSLKKNLCSNPDWHLRREAVPGTVQFFPLSDNGRLYGAILQGEHYFFITEKGKPEYRDGRARFNHLWLQENGQWVMVRILSYNHGPAAPVTPPAIQLSAAALQKFAGRYQGPQNTITLLVSGKGLQISNNGKGMELLPSSPTGFFSPERPLKFEFVRNPAGKVTVLRVFEKGTLTEELKKVE